jgi:hypothetical protein
MYASIVGSFILATASMAVPRVAFFESSMTRERVSPGVGCQARSSSCAFWRRTASGYHRCPKKKLVETGPVMLGIQIPVEVGDVPPIPREGHYQDQQAKIFVVLPMQSGAQGAKELV